MTSFDSHLTDTPRRHERAQAHSSSSQEKSQTEKVISCVSVCESTSSKEICSTIVMKITQDCVWSREPRRVVLGSPLPANSFPGKVGQTQYLVPGRFSRPVPLNNSCLLHLDSKFCLTEVLPLTFCPSTHSDLLITMRMSSFLKDREISCLRSGCCRRMPPDGKLL